MKKFAVTLCCIFFLVFSSALFASGSVYAQDCSSAEECQKQIDDLTKKLKDNRTQQNTLNSTLSYLNAKILLTQKQIAQSQLSIAALQKDITDLSGRIGELEKSLYHLTDTLISRVQESYKSQLEDPLVLLFFSNNFSDFIGQYKYLQLAKERTRTILDTTETEKVNYDLEKQAKEQKQQQLVIQRQLLEKQKMQLASQQNSKQRLLVETRSSETVYQSQLATAIAQLSALRGFSQSKDGGLLPPQNSPDGWFFSQRDQRWGNMCIGDSCGTSNEGTIMDVGCLISDVAMVKKKFGENVSPASIAANSSYFFSTTAYMLQPWPAPSGYKYQNGGYDQTKINDNLKDGRPVIVHLKINTRDGHFIVLKSGSDGDYTMHDPWEGYDKKFNDFYSKGQIVGVAYLVKN